MILLVLHICARFLLLISHISGLRLCVCFFGIQSAILSVFDAGGSANYETAKKTSMLANLPLFIHASQNLYYNQKQTSIVVKG